MTEDLLVLFVVAYDDANEFELKAGYKAIIVPRAALAYAESFGLLNRTGYFLRSRLNGDLMPHRWSISVRRIETRGHCRGVLFLKLDPTCDAPPDTWPPIGSLLEIETLAGAD